jgi:hypothetical protein
MRYDAELLEREKQGILERLFRSKGSGRVTDLDECRNIHQLGTIERLLILLRSTGKR